MTSGTKQLIAGFAVKDQQGHSFLLLVHMPDAWAAGVFAERLNQRCRNGKRISLIGTATELPKQWFRELSRAAVARNSEHAEELALADEEPLRTTSASNDIPAGRSLKAG